MSTLPSVIAFSPSERPSEADIPVAGRFAPIVLKKSPPEVFWVVRGDRRAGACLLSGRHRSGQRDQLCQLSEVLDGGSEQELVLAPNGPLSLSRSRRRMRLRCANSISIFFRSRREVT